MKNINLHDLLKPWIPSAPICFIKNITLDSRIATAGDLFIAIIGHKLDGRCYIHEAIKKGVAAIIIETKEKKYNGIVLQLQGIPIIYFNNICNNLSEIAGRFYQNPSYSMNLIGITGTNGKTTTAHLLAQWANLLGEKSAVMGTIGNGTLNKINPTDNTTISAVENQKFLVQLKRQKIKFAAMEVSSHSLIQHRVNNLYFSAAIFTNLSRDHIDYHKNMKNYKEAKWKLFNELHVKHAIINADDKVGYSWLSKLPHGVSLTSCNQQLLNKHLQIITINYNSYGMNIYFNSSWGKGYIFSKLLGKFNVYNLLLALLTMLTLGYPLKLLLNTANRLRPVLGRMEIFSSVNYPIIIVDYAHTPDALKNALIEIKLHYKNSKLWCIFGCGGDRDKGKRPIMGSIAEQYADQIIITNDNLRNEDSKSIINDIKSGLLNVNKVKIISNRIQAIETIVKQASINDIIFLAGKGHELTQIIGCKQINYSDITFVKKLIEY